jgi:hypothetical protein
VENVLTRHQLLASEVLWDTVGWLVVQVMIPLRDREVSFAAASRHVLGDRCQAGE